MIEEKIDVLDNGFVSLIEHTPNPDLLSVNAARVSFGKKKTEITKGDENLIRYLIKHRHDSPFRHAHLTFRIKAPEFIMRQWYKHVVGVAYSDMREIDHAWNEISGRYVEYEDEFYHPEKFRKQSANNKQATINESIDREDEAREIFEKSVKSSYESYKKLLDLNTGKEIARAILPLNFYTEVVWTASLQAVLNFITLRSHEGSQYEIRLYAEAVKELVAKIAPITLKAWEDSGR